MGVSLTQFIEGEPITLEQLKDKVVIIDSYNFLYQFLTSLRGPDGSLLTDSKGNVTSHLLGLFSRTTKLMQAGLKLVFVFDGEPPLLKQKELEKRKKVKLEAQKEYEIAKEREDVDAMRKFAGRTTRLTQEMVDDAKKLLTLLGLPVIQAPSEGEAQAAYMVKHGDADYIASQDTDSLLFGAPKVIRNLSILGRKKKTSKLTVEFVQPEVVTLEKTINQLGIDHKKLIILSMLVGTDFNNGGIKGIGPKNALKLVKQHDDYNQLFLETKWSDFFDYDWHEVYDLFNDMPYNKDYVLEWKAVNSDELKQFLIQEREFSQERVESTLKKLEKITKELNQKGLGDFF